ncbi:MAG: ATP-binding cassette domain-containing protein [Actinobacteria bacterium]|nr:MAG: ATP-binding cassette domain-containing protein [Actinomycetota bacterium]
MAAAVVTESIERRFDDTMAVDGVDLEVREGEIYGFLGPNGAGKSTLVRMLCTLLLPSAGRALVLGHDVATQPGQVRLRIGVALQDAALDDRQTGRELLTLQARLYGLHRAEVDERVEHVLRIVDIGDAIDRRIGTYSGGMKRRLDLAAALVHNPDVLFLDEPTTGLDPASRALVWREVRRLNQELGMTIFLTTQYLEEADELADRVGIIDHGKLVAEGAPDELKRAISDDVIVARVEGAGDDVIQALCAIDGVDQVDVHGEELTVRTANGAAAVSPVAVALSRDGVKVHTLTLRTPTLDDVFLELTGGHIDHGHIDNKGDGDPTS